MAHSPRNRSVHKVGTGTATLIAVVGALAGCSGSNAHPTSNAAPAANPAARSGPVTHPDADHAGSGLQPKPAAFTPPGLPGLDVSGHQRNVNWNAVKAKGAKFAYVKATESTTYRNAYFGQQYNGSAKLGLIRGAYHFALPNTSSGAAQARYFAANGGRWSADGKTLPGMLDIEYNPYGSVCYGKSKSAMVAWIRDFITTYHAKTGRWAVVYTTLDWWRRCTGNYGGFAKRSPLFIARYSRSAGTLPAGWRSYTFWQYASSGTFPGDQDVFKGSIAKLRALAKNK